MPDLSRVREIVRASRGPKPTSVPAVAGAGEPSPRRPDEVAAALDGEVCGSATRSNG